jgi:2-furoate---CoA ligase
MLDLGTSFLASVARDPDAVAIVDGETRLSYRAWFGHISALVAGLGELGVKPGDHVVSLLQNRWEAATLHWACQFAGIIITPLNWRATADELEFCLADAEAVLLVHEDVAEAAVVGAPSAAKVPWVRLAESPSRLREGLREGDARGTLHPPLTPPASGRGTPMADLLAASAADATPRADAEAWSLMLYTSGTTSRPKGVPRRHRAERAAAIAHVAQNLYGRGERTLGVMPLYHTMGVRSLLAMSLIGGTFVCLPRFDVPAALAAIERERISNLYLVPTLYHDLVQHPGFAATDTASVRKLGFAGAPMTDGLLQKLQAAFRPELFVNHYGSSEIYTCTINADAVRKPGCAGRAGLNQMIRVVALGASDPHRLAAPGEEGEIAALLAGDEAFEGYWRRPDANARALCDGWFLTGDTGYVDADGDLYVTGRVDDMIITGGENVSPVEIESRLSLHPAVAEVAVVGLPDERWGKLVTAFVKRCAPVSAEELAAYCRSSGLANFKRPRRFVFVAAVPKSPVGKVLRRKLVAGDYTPERS